MDRASHASQALAATAVATTSVECSFSCTHPARSQRPLKWEIIASIIDIPMHPPRRLCGQLSIKSIATVPPYSWDWSNEMGRTYLAITKQKNRIVRPATFIIQHRKKEYQVLSNLNNITESVFIIFHNWKSKECKRKYTYFLPHHQRRCTTYIQNRVFRRGPECRGS